MSAEAAGHFPLPPTGHRPRFARPSSEFSRNRCQPPERLQCRLQAQRGHCLRREGGSQAPTLPRPRCLGLSSGWSCPWGSTAVTGIAEPVPA